MTPDRSHSDTVGRVANKVRVEGGLLLQSEISLFWRTSCARDFFHYYFISLSSSSSLPIVNINSQDSHSFRGVVTHAKLASVANTEHA